jgi:hypothetical protein
MSTCFFSPSDFSIKLRIAEQGRQGLWGQNGCSQTKQEDK